MVYTVTNIKQFTSARGTNYQRADLSDMNGQSYEGVACFAGEFNREGMSIDGVLESDVYNGKTSYKFKSKPSVTGGKTAQVEKAMERKETSIANFQDSKEKSIQHAGAITNATHLTVAMLGQMKVGTLDPKEIEDLYKTKLRELIIFYKNLYENPQDINPSSSEQPF